jgi:hypothetical protein
MMPVAHRMTRDPRCGGILSGAFPEWTWGPSVSRCISGVQQHPDGNGEESRFFSASCGSPKSGKLFPVPIEFIGQAAILPGSLFNDEIDVAIIGPSLLTSSSLSRRPGPIP